MSVSNTLTFGKPDGSHLEKPTYSSDTRFELVDGSWDRFVCPLPPFGLTQASGYPALGGLYDGLFLAANNSPFDPAASATDPIALYGTGTLHGTDYYDWAADGEVPAYMIFTAGRYPVAGADRPYPFQLNGSYAAVEDTGDNLGKPIISADYAAVAGDFGSSSVTGIRGNFRGWFSTPHIAPGEDITTYTAGSKLTILKGFLKKFDPNAVDKNTIVYVDKTYTNNGVTKFRGHVSLTSTQNVA